MLFLGLFFFITLTILTVCDSLRLKITPTPSNRKVVMMLSNFINHKADFKKIVDLGSGFGLTLVFLALKFPQIEFLGIEDSYFPFLFSTLLKKVLKIKNLNFVKGNFFHLKEIHADMIYCYLYPDKSKAISYFLKKVLKPKTLVCSSTFALKLKLEQEIKVPDMYQTPLYIYEI